MSYAVVAFNVEFASRTAGKCYYTVLFHIHTQNIILLKNMMEHFLEECMLCFGCCPLIFIQNWRDQNYFHCCVILGAFTFETRPFKGSLDLCVIAVRVRVNCS